MNTYDDWAEVNCDVCGEYRKCYRQDDEPLNEYGEPHYYCASEDCKSLQYFNSKE